MSDTTTIEYTDRALVGIVESVEKLRTMLHNEELWDEDIEAIAAVDLVMDGVVGGTVDAAELVRVL